MNQTGSKWFQYISLVLYSCRWNIEISYYEQKTLCYLYSYMVRSFKEIEKLINLINNSYSAMKLLPYVDDKFACYRNKSVQDFIFALSDGIRSQLFFHFRTESRNPDKINLCEKCLKISIFLNMSHL